MDTSHSRLLTASGYLCQATPGHDPSTVRPAGPRRAAQPVHGQPAPVQPATAHSAPVQPVAACALGPALASVGAGRSFTRTALRRWGLAGVCDQAELVVSELVTNAIQHGLRSARQTIGDYPVGLRLLAQAPFVTCMVTDPGRQLPIRDQSDPMGESGRGLHVVESCSLRWGWQPLEAGGKVVWALLEQDLRPQRRRTARAGLAYTGR
jgi:anti-sigma regulatory factor (Ser/Thr protein kinase)